LGDYFTVLRSGRVVGRHRGLQCRDSGSWSGCLDGIVQPSQPASARMEHPWKCYALTASRSPGL
jgi:hypothetical protein